MNMTPHIIDQIRPTTIIAVNNCKIEASKLRPNARHLLSYSVLAPQNTANAEINVPIPGKKTFRMQQKNRQWQRHAWNGHSHWPMMFFNVEHFPFGAFSDQWRLLNTPAFFAVGHAQRDV